jgi:diguanylate cyclase (GGDEF)-like protein
MESLRGYRPSTHELDRNVTRHWPTWLVTLTVLAAYGLGAFAAFVAFGATAIVVLFLPAGVTLSALVLTPRKQWPWILAAAALAEVTVDTANGIHPVAAIGFALANTAEPLVGATLLRRSVGGRVDLLRYRDVLAFFSYCVLVAPIVGGLIGATTIYLSEQRPWLDAFLSFWAGDGLGVLTVGGAVLSWRYMRPDTGRKVVVLLLAALAMVAATAVGFWPSAPLFYLPIPLLFWIAIRFPLPVMATSGLMMTVTANVLTSADRGPWAALASTPQLEMATLQLFIGTTVTAAWFLAVSIAERDIARSATSAERAVRQRIQGLQAVTAQLATAVTSDAVAEIVTTQGMPLLAEHGTVAVVSGDRRSVAVRATPSLPPSIAARYRQLPITAAAPVTQVVRTGERVVEQTTAGMVASFPELRDDLATLGISSILCVPVNDGKAGTLGALAFGLAHENTVDADTMSFAETLASLTGQALRRARLYDTEHETARQLQRQADALNNALRIQEALQRQLTFRVLHDPLTGLANREMLAERLESSLRGSGVHPPAALFLMDVDDFKAVNDTYGHTVGDSVLVEVARRLARVAPSGSLTARLGGDEFAVLMANASAEQAHIWADRLRRSFLQPFRVDGLELQVSASVGVLLADGAEHSTLMAALRDADVALYAAKDGGRDRAVLFEPALRRARLERTALAAGLRHVDFETEFNLVYQPVVDLTSGRPAWIEALARWTRPDGQQVPPATFIPLAEETGRIHALGAWVLRRAMLDTSALLQARGQALVLSVNISSRQLDSDQFADLVLRELSAAGVPPSSLILEITETTLVTLSRIRGSAIAQLDRLRGHGVRIALDDFGTGYSSLSTIAQLPVDVAKLDRSFSQRVPGHSQAPRRRFLRAVFELAKSLDLQIVAEGVETREQADLLRELDCPLGQGNYFAVPAEIQSLDALLGGDHCVQPGITPDEPVTAC